MNSPSRPRLMPLRNLRAAMGRRAPNMSAPPSGRDMVATPESGWYGPGGTGVPGVTSPSAPRPPAISPNRNPTVTSPNVGMTATQRAGGQEALAAQAMGMRKGGKVSSASKRADGIAQRGKTKGRMI